MSTVSQRKERRDRISLGISATSLALGVAALLLNEKPQEVTEMNNRERTARAGSPGPSRSGLPPAKTNKELREQRKELKQRYKTAIQDAAIEAGFTGKVIVRNRMGIEEEYELVPVSRKSATKTVTGSSAKSKPSAKKKTASKPKAKTSSKTAVGSGARSSAPVKKSWVAMEVDARDGSGTVAVTCDTKDEAAELCRQFARSHRPGSGPAKFCIQRYAYLDTSKPVDVAQILLGRSNITTYGI